MSIATNKKRIKKATPKRGFFLLAFVVNLCLFSIGLLGFLAHFANLPQAVFQLAAIFSFYTFFLALLMLLFGLIFKKWSWVLWNVLSIIFLIPLFSLNFKIIPAPKKTPNLTVVNWNVAQLKLTQNGLLDIHNQLLPLNADVVCLQEFGIAESWQQHQQNIEKIKQIFGFEHVAFFKAPHNVFGLLVMSNFPIVNQTEIFLPNNHMNGAVAVTVLAYNKKLLLINTHLHSFQNQNLTGSFFKKAEITMQNQQEETNKIKTFLAQQNSDYIIITGDFNATPGSWVYQELAKSYFDAFLHAGQGFGFTFNSVLVAFRIDYQFCLKSLIPVDFHEISNSL